MLRTLEGFLICKNVPIARTGEQEYYEHENNDNAPEEIKQESSKDNATPEHSVSLDSDKLESILQELQGLKAEVLAIKAKETGDEDALDKLESALEAETDQSIEEDVTESIEEMDEEGALDNTISSNASDAAFTVTRSVGDRKAALELIRTLKPVIAGMGDPDQKKLATDALTKLVYSTNSKFDHARNNGYAAILNTKKQNAERKVSDAKTSQGFLDDRELGRSIAASRNPHYMKNKNNE